MTWVRWLRQREIEPHVPSRAAIAANLTAAERALRDAALSGMSAEGSFQFSYGAALLLATAVVMAMGYRLRAREGHHLLVFRAAGLALGPRAASYARHFLRSRRRRHVLQYLGGELDPADAHLLRARSQAFQQIVLDWLRRERPDLSP